MYVDGGYTIQRFIDAGLMDEITVTVIPVLLGEGRRLFGPTRGRDIWLELDSSKAYPFGFVQGRYVFVRGND